MNAFALTLTLLVIAHSAYLLKHRITFQSGRLMLDPTVVYLLFTHVSILLPQLAMHIPREFATAYHTFIQGENEQALIAASIHVLIANTCIALSGNRQFNFIRFQSSFRQQSPFRPGRVAALAFALISVSIGISFGFFGATNVASSLITSTIAGDLYQFAVDYNQLRYSTEKAWVLEHGIRGIGTLTSVMHAGSLSACGLATTLWRIQPKRSSLLLLLGIAPLTVLVSLTTGSRADFLSPFLIFGVFIILTQRFTVARAATVILAILTAYSFITLITPKRAIEENPLLNLVQRLGGNAANDAILIGAIDAKQFDFNVLTVASSQDFNIIDRQLNFFLTGDNTQTWYESPTSVGIAYALGGIPMVILNALLTSLVACLIGRSVFRSPHVHGDPALIGLAAVWYWKLPFTGWLSAPLCASVGISLLIFALMYKSRLPGRPRQTGHRTRNPVVQLAIPSHIHNPS